MEDTIVSRAALARELKLDRSTVARYAQRGLPVRPDGRLNREEALRWIRQYVSSAGGGWAHRGKLNTAEKAGAALSGRAPATAATPNDRRITFYEQIRNGLQTLPAVLLQVKPAVEPWLLLAAVEGLDMVLGSIVLSIDPDVISDGQRAVREPDYPALFKQAGLRLTKKQWVEMRARSEAFKDALAETLT